MSGLTLYQIADELVEIEGLLIEAEGELTPEVEARLDAMTGALESKVERICEVIQGNKRAAEAAKAEADRLYALARSRERIESSPKSYLLVQLQAMHRDRVDTDRFVVRVQKNGRPSIRWMLPPESAPEQYRRVKVEVDGQRAYEDWKAGETLPEGFTVEIGHHLRIR